MPASSEESSVASVRLSITSLNEFSSDLILTSEAFLTYIGEPLEHVIDGIDSNGNYVQTGGFVLVKGGSSSGNVSGSIDVDGTVTITGGTCVALGGVCETPVNSVNAYVLSSVSFSSGSYSLKDASGNEVISFTVDGSFSNGWICSDTLTTGTSYTLYRGSDSIADWTQESGTMGASNNGGFGGGRI